MSSKIERRDVLLSGLAGGLTAAGIIAADRWVPRLRAPGLEKVADPFGEPAFVNANLTVIQNGVNLRDYPAIPTPPVLRLPRERIWNRANVARWEDIETVNGVPLSGAQMFVIENAPVVKGEDTYKYPPRPANYKHYGYWLRFDLKLKGRTVQKPHFVDYSWQTRQFVWPIVPGYSFTSYERTSDQEIILKNGLKLTKEDIGRVIVPSSTDELELVYLWGLQMPDKLEGKLPVAESERRYEEVMTVPAGFSWAEIMKMKELDLPVEVQDFPAKKYPNGDPVKVIGDIKLGTTIRNVVITDWQWGVFRRADVSGGIYDKDGNLLVVDPEKLLVVDSAFLLSTSSPILTGQQVPRTSS